MTALNRPTLKLFLLGSPLVELAGRTITIPRRKAFALLAYLAVNDTLLRRDTLAALFWPELSQSRARTALSRRCSELKQILGEKWIVLEPSTVGILHTTDLWLDVAHFQQVLARCKDSCADALPLLTKAVALHRADFLSGFTLSDCPDFDDWQAMQTETLRQTLSEALGQLVQIHISKGTYSEGITHAQSWLSLDPWQELAHQQLMALHIYQQAPVAALHHFEQYRQSLSDEFGVAPGPEITALYEQIRHGDSASLQIRRQRRTGDIELPAFLRDPLRRSSAETNSPFVAREEELERLQSALNEAKAGRSQPLFVIGGPGRGKTTLLNEFARRALESDPDLLVVSGHANAYTGGGDPYLPWRAALNLLLGDVEAGVTGGLLTPNLARRLWTVMSLTLPLLADYAPDLVGNFVPARPLLARAEFVADRGSDWMTRLENAAAASVNARLEQLRLFEQVTVLLHAIAAQRPLLLILEDLHWADTSSINLLFHCCRQLGGHRICLVGSYRHNAVAVARDGHPHPLVGVMAELKRQHGEIWLDLAAVDALHGRSFVDSYLNAQAGARLSESFREALFSRTGGHPLFTVEMVHDLQARGELQRAEDGFWVEAQPINWDELPAKAEGVIEQRLNGLEADLRQALSIASVEGETFTAEVVAHVQGSPSITLVQRLSAEVDRQHHLVRVQTLEQIESQRLSRYRFRHLLFQRYLYQHLDESERVYLHEAVGQALEAIYGDQVAQYAVSLARHFQLAGRAEKAIAYLQTAAESAMRKSAFVEAERHLRLALDLLARLPLTPERNEQEITIQVVLGQTLLVAKGFGRQEVAQAFNRARDLCRQVGETPQLFTALYGLSVYYSNQAQLHTAHEMAQQLLRIAQRQKNEEMLMMAHRQLGVSAFFLGELASSRTHLTELIAAYTPHQHHALLLRYGGFDSGVLGQSIIAMALWLLGYPDQALRQITEAVALARTLDHPLSVVFALICATVVHLCRGEAEAARICIDEAITLTTEHGLIAPQATAIINQGQVMIVEDAGEAGIARLEQGLADMQATGSKATLVRGLTWLAEAYGKAGQIQQALAVADKAETVMTQTDQRYWEAEYHHVRGDLLLMQGADIREVEACYSQGIEVARRQEAKLLELRATVSLCRLWQQQNRKEEGRQMLAEICGWFSEGFDTADLIEAREMMADLSS